MNKVMKWKSFGMGLGLCGSGLWVTGEFWLGFVGFVGGRGVAFVMCNVCFGVGMDVDDWMLIVCEMMECYDVMWGWF